MNQRCGVSELETICLYFSWLCLVYFSVLCKNSSFGYWSIKLLTMVTLVKPLIKFNKLLIKLTIFSPMTIFYNVVCIFWVIIIPMERTEINNRKFYNEQIHFVFRLNDFLFEFRFLCHYCMFELIFHVIRTSICLYLNQFNSIYQKNCFEMCY